MQSNLLSTLLIYLYKLKLKRIFLNRPIDYNTITKSNLYPKIELLGYGDDLECNKNGLFINNQCRCNPNYLGPTCYYYIPFKTMLFPKHNFTLTSFTDGIDYHMRLESDLKNWIGVGFSTVNVPTDGMTNVDFVVIHKKNNNWVIEDMWGIGFSMPKLDDQQNLINPVVWETSNKIIGTWSRKIKSTDTLEDLPFSYGMMTNVSYAIGYTNFLNMHEYSNTILCDISHIGPVPPNVDTEPGIKILITFFSILTICLAASCFMLYIRSKDKESVVEYRLVKL